MKNLIFCLLICCFSTTLAYSQLEVKTQPTGWATKTISLGLEYGFKPHLGLEVEYQRFQDNKMFLATGNAGFIALKHYFLNDKQVALSNFYVGGYGYYLAGESKLNTKTTSLTMSSFGVTSGYKWLFFNHLVLEPGLNLGKRFVYEDHQLAKPTSPPITKFFYNWDVSFRLLVGYRF